MVKGSGIDILATGRFRKLKNKVEFINNVLTPAEKKRSLAYFRRDRFYAALFTLKEAILKSLGCGLGRGSSWHHVELDRKMLPRISRSFIRSVDEQPVEKVHVSVACTKDYALGVALAETEQSPAGGV
jgi:holo-[acyl-carrier protein] synthase